jgi:hypothetical protein
MTALVYEAGHRRRAQKGEGKKEGEHVHRRSSSCILKGQFLSDTA